MAAVIFSDVYTQWYTWEVSLHVCIFVHIIFQISMAAVIFFNFVAQCVQTQRLDQPGSPGAVFFDALEDACTLIYCLELGLNVFSTWCWEFVLNGWNYFDMLVIAASVYTVITNQESKTTNVFRLLRAFRVLRLFSRLPSLKIIIDALYSSIPSMSNAMALTAIVICMCVVVGVQCFYAHAASLCV